jgi:hypothetical protein
LESEQGGGPSGQEGASADEDEAAQDPGWQEATSSGSTWPTECAGLQLGAQSARYRDEYRKDKLSTTNIEELSALGFPFDWSEWKWEYQVKSAFTIYKELHGDLNVPKQLVVPSCEPWPEETWGLNLGRRAAAIRCGKQYATDDKKEWLDAMGFVWDTDAQRWKLLKTALVMYREMYGDINVTQKYVVPSCEPWPEETWGTKLGLQVTNMRNKGFIVGREENPWLDKHGRPTRREWLDKEGFVWDERKQRWGLLQRALTVYKKMNGDLNVSQKFVIPSSEPWPEEVQGMKLGHTVSQVRLGRHQRGEERMKWLIDLGFTWDDLERRWERTEVALAAYKEVFGHLNVRYNFVVPSAEPWPEVVWGMKLGGVVVNIKYRGDFIAAGSRNSIYPDRREWLESMGACWLPAAEKGGAYFSDGVALTHGPMLLTSEDSEE